MTPGPCMNLGTDRLFHPRGGRGFQKRVAYQNLTPANITYENCSPLRLGITNNNF